MSSGRSLAVQVDLDTLPVLAGFFGGKAGDGPGGESIRALERFRGMFHDEGVRATLFVVGRDLEDGEYAGLVRRMSLEGHEIANHTQSHPHDVTDLSPNERRREIGECESAVEALTGSRPVGFRAPCYRPSGAILDIIADAGYLYDASVLPSPFVFAMKAFHVATGLGRSGGGSGPGSAAHAMGTRRVHRVERPGARGLVEVPVATTAMRFPVTSTTMLRVPAPLFSLLGRKHVSFTFHLVDLMDPGGLPAEVLRRHPTAGMPLERKLGRCLGILRALGRACDLVTTREMVEVWIDRR
jgi:peptidoglycan/xylan/chitin deacetylase (PgdA/CDA1 family)